MCATLERERPDVCVIDSVQTLHAADLGSAPGSVAQVREAAGRLLRVAKETGVATILVGHVTKDGAVAGPRVLEHLVDCVLQFEGDRYHAHRILRATKNRFGSTNELGVFEMTGTGLVGVPDPSELFGSTHPGEVGAAVGCALEGTRPLLLEVQALVAQTGPRDAAARRDGRRPEAARDDRRRARPPRGARRSAAPTSSSTSPAVCAIEEPGADLAIALAIASAARGVPVREGSRRVRRDRPHRQAAARGTGGAAPRRVRKLGIAAVVAPEGTATARTALQVAGGGDAARRDRRRPRTPARDPAKRDA